MIDSSAILAILQNEPERRSFNEAIQSAEFRLLCAASLLELSIVLEARFGTDGQGELDFFVSAAEIEVISFDPGQAELARMAFRRFGKGRHRTGLNLGACFSYTLAQSRSAPLLYEGDDFSHTDLAPAIPAGITSQPMTPCQCGGTLRDYSSAGQWLYSCDHFPVPIIPLGLSPLVALRFQQLLNS